MLAIIYIIHNIGPIAIYEKWKKEDAMCVKSKFDSRI